MFSILLATYNGEKYIRETIDSVLNQNFPYWELLIGFNGTTDNTKNIISEYKDFRIKTFDYGDDKGKAKTLNKLLKEANYEWLAIQDDDDVWMHNKLQKQTAYVNMYDVVGSFIHYIDEYGEITFDLNLAIEDEKIKQLSLSGNNQVANTSAIFKKSAAFDVDGWREDIDGMEDFDFWLRLIRKEKNFFNIPEYLVMHRVHKQSNFNTKAHNLESIL